MNKQLSLKKVAKQDIVILMCNFCSETAEDSRWKEDYLCGTCKHNKWAANQLDVKFGGRDDLPLIRT